MKKAFSPLALGMLVMAAMAVTGCKTYTERIENYHNAVRAGDLDRATPLVQEMVEDYAEEDDDRDALVVVLEAANTSRVKGDLEQSQREFARAERMYEAWQQKARVSLSKEGFSLLTNPATLPYRGSGADILMVNTYQALNALALGDRTGARQPLMRLDSHQKDVVAENAERIAKSREAVEKDKNSEQINQSYSSTEVKGATEKLMAELPDTRGYELYTNPFSEFLFAFYHRYLGADMADAEMARFRMGRALAMAPENTTLRQEVESVEAMAPIKPSVFLVHENGMAPYRKEFMLWLPIYAGNTFSSVSIALPYMEVDKNCPGFATLCGGNASAAAEMVCDMEAVLAQEYKNDYPVILTRAIASATFKAAVSYATNYAVRNAGGGVLGQLGAFVATAAYQYGTTAADTRSWVTLPKHFGVSRIDLPEDRKVSVKVEGKTIPVPLPADGSVFIVYLRTMQRGSTPHVSVIKVR